MHIVSLGVNHQNTPIHLREKLNLSEAAASSALACLGRAEDMDGIAEMVILSTCNRTELYAAGLDPAFCGLEQFLERTCQVQAAEFRPFLYRHSDHEAVSHLMQVAAGLDSLVIGEPQILGQVGRAFELARQCGATGPLLSRLFQSALHAGKRARTETSIGRSPASISSLAASLCEHILPGLRQAQVVILGAGEMASLAVEALRQRGVEKITVVNRTHERAFTLAKNWGAEAATFAHLESTMQATDILIASTGARRPVVPVDMVARVMAQRPQRPLVLIDIAVPRDIAEQAGGLPNVYLYNIDNLSQQLQRSLDQRAGEIPLVNTILAEEEAEYINYLRSLDMLPIIAGLRQQAELIRRDELNRTLRRLPGLTETERERIEAMTLALVKKLLEHPTNRLRAEANSPRAPEYADVARTLFGLAGEPASFYSISASLEE